MGVFGDVGVLLAGDKGVVESPAVGRRVADTVVDDDSRVVAHKEGARRAVGVGDGLAQGEGGEGIVAL